MAQSRATKMSDRRGQVWGRKHFKRMNAALFPAAGKPEHLLLEHTLQGASGQTRPSLGSLQQRELVSASYLHLHLAAHWDPAGLGVSCATEDRCVVA